MSTTPHTTTADVAAATAVPVEVALPGSARLGRVELTVRDLGASIAFYTGALGLVELGRDGAVVELGAATDGESLLVLHGDPDARRAGRRSGLYHVALLYPTRLELASALLRLAGAGVPIGGASDHGISEAIYLDDPDGIGLELAVDRPAATWPDRSSTDLDQWRPRPLDIDGLIRLAAGSQPPATVDPAVRVGHVHLHVGDMDAATRHYRDVIGFDVMTQLPGATFVSVAGYHHHVGFNTWRGEGIPNVQPGAVGMRHAVLHVTDPHVVDAIVARARAARGRVEQWEDGALVDDPAGNRLLVRP